MEREGCARPPAPGPGGGGGVQGAGMRFALERSPARPARWGAQPRCLLPAALASSAPSAEQPPAPPSSRLSHHPPRQSRIPARPPSPMRSVQPAPPASAPAPAHAAPRQALSSPTRFKLHSGPTTPRRTGAVRGAAQASALHCAV